MPRLRHPADPDLVARSLHPPLIIGRDLGWDDPVLQTVDEILRNAEWREPRHRRLREMAARELRADLSPATVLDLCVELQVRESAEAHHGSNPEGMWLPQR